MIYITGDVHGELERLFEIADTKNLKSGDKLIICGDFGFIWETRSRKGDFEDKILDKISEFPFEILWVDGNHENFNKLYKYPEVKRYGSPTHKIRDNIYHLQRGRLYTIDNYTFFVFGGAFSTDRGWRVKDFSWWDQEIPTGEEMDRGTETLADCGFKVDYILTHTAPSEIMRRMGYGPDRHDAEFTGYLEWVMYETNFRKWFFGHFHEDRQVTDRMFAVYKKVHTV